ncbi:hypothetical protein AMR72_15835 [Flavobacterium psychrophilum]|nr:hypothetical protein AMR72_15835 [Flavobacterium psychrophilum]AOE53845.1 hypothetical protein ALW18_15825 [Flavobacterium psychrophilum]
MKTKLLIALFAFTLMSCSDDERYPETTVTIPSDPDNGNPTDPVVVEKKLEKILYINYREDGTISSTGKFEFDDAEKMVLVDGFSATGVPLRKREFTYNEKGLLINTNFHESGSSNTTFYEYDALGRIVKTSNAYAIYEAVFTNRLFTYEDDGSITVDEKVYEDSLEEGGGEIILSQGQYKYYKDAAGNIYKKTAANGNVITEAVYGNGNIVSYTSGSSSISFGFNTTNLPKGQYHNISKNAYGGLQNAILIEGFAAVGLGISNYVTEQNAVDKTTYAYEFDKDGYPVKISFFKNDSDKPFQIREISYK